jgi:hypothetical protein
VRGLRSSGLSQTLAGQQRFTCTALCQATALCISAAKLLICPCSCLPPCVPTITLNYIHSRLLPTKCTLCHLSELSVVLCRGVDIKKTLHDFENYSNPDFYSCLPQKQPSLEPSQAIKLQPQSAAAAGSVGSGFDVPDSVPFRDGPCPNYARCLHAWDRQAAYIPWALQVRTCSSSSNFCHVHACVSCNIMLPAACGHC